MRHRMTRRLEFDAGHRVPLHASKCRSPHGHRYVVELTCSSEGLTREGFVIDFGDVKRIVGGWIDDHLDHTMIGQRGDELLEAIEVLCIAQGLKPFYWMDDAPTAENLARKIFRHAELLLADRCIEVVSVVVHETPNCRAEWSES
jgi:6-pyruvoyltetrahydropterin/6-carboxytetrahydropterin synthase